MSDEEDKSTDLATMRKWTDVMPLSSNKIDTINQFVDSDKLSYYLPFIMYHGDWSNITSINEKISQQTRECSYLKGITSTNKKSPVDNLIDVSGDNTTSPLSEKVERCLDDLLKYCNSLDCQVVFTRFPHRITNQGEYLEFKQQNRIEQLVSKKGFDFINFDKLFCDLNLSPNEDFYGDSHMNVNGQKKMTAYLGKLLFDKYKISKTVLTMENQKKWDTSVKYTELFYKYFQIHENDEQVYWWQETPELLKQLESLE